MGDTTLWRVEGAASMAAPSANEALVLGMRRHLAHAPLYSSLVQIAEQQRAYVSLDGCSGCSHSRCEVGCRVEALRRTLRAAYGVDTAQLSIVRKGLTPRPYTRCYVLQPIVASSVPLLDGKMLAQWPEARLTMGWEGQVKTQQAVTVVLYIGADGPEPYEVVADVGWKAQKRLILPLRGVPAFPAHDLVTLGARFLWTREPWLLLPTVVPAQAAEQLAHALADEVVL